MAAPTFDGSSFSDQADPGSSGSSSFASHALNASANAVVVCAHINDAAGDITAVTVAGNSATQVGTGTARQDRALARIFVYADNALGGTTPTIGYSYSGGPFDGVGFSILSFLGVNVADPIGASDIDAHPAGGDAAMSITFAATTDDICIDNATVDNQFRSFTPGAGQTVRTASDFNSTGHGATSTEAGATSVTMEQTISSAAAADAVQIGFALQGGASAVTLVLPDVL